jgi:hypothetical protein
MVKGRRNDKRPGPKKTRGPKAKAPSAAVFNLNVGNYKKKNRDLLLALAAFSGRGTPYEYGQCLMAVQVMLQLIDEDGKAMDDGTEVKSKLTWDDEAGEVRGLNGIYKRAAQLTGMGTTKLASLLGKYLESNGTEVEVGDNTTRGRASPDCDRIKLRKLSVEHYSAIQAFIDFRNSSSSAGKVCVGIGGGRLYADN